MKQIKYLLILILFLSCNIFVYAKNTSLDIIKQDIKKYQVNIGNIKGEQQKVKEQIRLSQKQIDELNMQLQKILQEQRLNIDKIKQIEKENSILDKKISRIKNHIANILKSQYKNDNPQLIVLLLKNINPNDKGRMIEYFKYIQKENNNTINKLKKLIDENNVNKQSINNLISNLKKSELDKRSIINKLNFNNSKQLALSNELSKKIASYTNKISQLKKQEQELNKIVKNSSDNRKIYIKQSNKNSSKINNNKVNSNLTNEDLKLKEDNNKNILKKKISYPVTNAKIIVSYGDFKENGEIYKGMYFAKNNADVRSIADGFVVYSGYLKGYNNVVIVDHSNSYISVYAGLSKINVRQGDSVNKDRVIGKTGNSTFFNQNGLYFEIRHNSVQINPNLWFK